MQFIPTPPVASTQVVHIAVVSVLLQHQKRPVLLFDKKSPFRTAASMGRRPNIIVAEFFSRGAKLEDASNRYQHTCRRCGELVSM